MVKIEDLPLIEDNLKYDWVYRMAKLNSSTVHSEIVDVIKLYGIGDVSEYNMFFDILREHKCLISLADLVTKLTNEDAVSYINDFLTTEINSILYHNCGSTITIDSYIEDIGDLIELSKTQQHISGFLEYCLDIFTSKIVKMLDTHIELEQHLYEIAKDNTINIDTEYNMLCIPIMNTETVIYVNDIKARAELGKLLDNSVCYVTAEEDHLYNLFTQVLNEAPSFNSSKKAILYLPTKYCNKTGYNIYKTFREEFKIVKI